MVGCTVNPRACVGRRRFLPWGSVGIFFSLPRGHRIVERLREGGAGRGGRATETSVPALGGHGRPLPCLLPGRRRAPRATPSDPASAHLCRICLHTRGISWALSPPSSEGAVLTCGWSSPPPGRRVGWRAGPCAAPACGQGLTHRGPSRLARVRGLGWRRAACPPTTTPASAWRRFGGRACSPLLVMEGMLPVVHHGRDCQLEVQVGGHRHRWPHPWFRRLGVVL